MTARRDELQRIIAELERDLEIARRAVPDQEAARKIARDLAAIRNLEFHAGARASRTARRLRGRAMTDVPYSVSIQQDGEPLRTFNSLTRDVAQNYLQEFVSAGVPIKNIDFGNGFDITVNIPDTLDGFTRLGVKWIVEGGPMR